MDAGSHDLKQRLRRLADASRELSARQERHAAIVASPAQRLLHTATLQGERVVLQELRNEIARLRRGLGELPTWFLKAA